MTERAAPAGLPAPPRLRRSLGLWATTLTGVGTILGAGIYVLIGEAAADAGSAVWISFMVAAVLAGATGLAYAELSSMFPEAGASSTYTRVAFGRRVGFLIGWLRLVIGVVGGAAVALGFGGYTAELTGADERLTTLLLILVAGLIVYVGVRQTVAVAIAMTVAETAGLLFVVAVGLPDLGSQALFDSPEGLFGVVAGASLLFFSYEGFEEIATLSEEARDPTRTVPRAILLAIVISTVLYITVSVVSVSVVHWTELAASDAPLADVVSVAAGQRFGDALAAIALFSTGNTVLMLLAGSARLSYGMAGRGLLPPLFRRVSATRQTPWAAVAIITGSAVVIAAVGEIRLVAQVTNFGIFVAFFGVNAAVIRLRISQPATPRPFRNGLTLRRVPLAPVIGGTAALLLMFTMDREALLAGLLAVVSGLLLSVVVLRREFPNGAPPGAGRAA